MNFYCDITKVNNEERIVEGYASTEAMDVQGEIVKLSAIEDALPDYMTFANIREMHQPSAVGKAVSAEVTDKGLYLSVHVVDDQAWEKVKKGVYNGFSIGGKSIAKSGGIISKLRLTEISLVDRPANPEAVFNLWKGDGMEKEHEVIEEVEKSTEVVEKSDEVVEVDAPIEKGMYDVARLASIINDLNYLQENTEWEAECEGDNSSIPMELKAQIKALGATLVSMASEEVAEIVGEAEEVVEMSEAIADVAKSDEVNNDIEKAGASISASNKTKLESIISLCKEVMGAEVTEKMAKADDEIDMKKAFELQSADIEKMAKEIEELKAMPAPSKLETAIIAKGEEHLVSKKADDLSVHDLIKMVHQGGR